MYIHDHIHALELWTVGYKYPIKSDIRIRHRKKILVLFQPPRPRAADRQQPVRAGRRVGQAAAAVGAAHRRAGRGHRRAQVR